MVHEIDYWRKLPGYGLTLSPENNPQIQFQCNPNCNILCYADDYGGILASSLLIEEIRQLLQPGYGDLALYITAKEGPHTWYAGETPDYFETDSLTRLRKNHQELNLSWIDPNLRAGDFEQMAQAIAVLIEAKLPFTYPDLEMTVSLFSDANSLVAQFEARYLLFRTMDLEE